MGSRWCLSRRRRSGDRQQAVCSVRAALRPSSFADIAMLHAGGLVRAAAFASRSWSPRAVRLMMGGRLCDTTAGAGPCLCISTFTAAHERRLGYMRPCMVRSTWRGLLVWRLCRVLEQFKAELTQRQSGDGSNGGAVPAHLATSRSASQPRAGAQEGRQPTAKRTRVDSSNDLTGTQLLKQKFGRKPKAAGEGAGPAAATLQQPVEQPEEQEGQRTRPRRQVRAVLAHSGLRCHIASQACCSRQAGAAEYL